MDGTRFDQIARYFALNRLTRRAALASGGVGLLAGLGVGGRSAAQQASTPEATPVAVPEGSADEILFVQGFRAGAFSPKEDAPDEFLLTLQDGLGYTVYFSDRPERQFGAVPTTRFLDGFDFGEENPPNAALVMQVADDQEDVVVLELTNPVHDETIRAVSYDAKVLGQFDEFAGQVQQEPVTSDALSGQFGTANLFIDSCSDHSIECCTAICDDVGCTCITTYGTFGPMGFCWSFGDICCHPCSNSDNDYWLEQCNSQFPGCNGQCRALYSGCL